MAAGRASSKRAVDEYAEKLATIDKNDLKALEKLASWCKKSKLKLQEKQVKELMLLADYQQRHTKFRETPDEKSYKELLSWCRKKKLTETEVALRQEWSEHQYAEKVKAIAADDAAGQLGVAKWCQEQGLYVQAVTQCRKILSADPKHSGARSLLTKCASKAKSKERGLLKEQRVPGYRYASAWYHIWVPRNHTTSKPLPLYIWLHGGHVGAGSANNTVALHQTIPEFKTGISIFPNHIYHFWTHPREMLYLLDTIDEVMLRFSVDPKRIYIMGTSMGGAGTWAMAAHFPELFAACSPNAGWWEHTPIEKAAVLPIYINHGSKDATIPIKWGRSAHAKLKEIDGVKIEYHEGTYGHAVPIELFAKAAAWVSSFTNPKTFDMEELKARARALTPPAWTQQAKYKWPEEFSE